MYENTNCSWSVQSTHADLGARQVALVFMNIYIRIQLKKNQTLKKNSVDINRSLL